MQQAYGLILLAFLVAAPPAIAARTLVHERVMAVKDDQTLVLSHTGNAQFANLAMPDAALAQTWLATHLLQQEIALRFVDEDRYGRSLIETDRAAEMLRAGAAVLFAQTPLMEGLQAAEDEARQARRGIWAQENFVLTPENAAQHFFEFHAVEGTITRIYQGKSGTYLNFGERWQEDFSVTIAGRNRRSFEALLEQLAPGTRVRVRGTIYHENGPMLRLTRPEQLQLL